MAKFNGHRNWNHWNVSLWINNDESLYRFAQECVRRTGQCRSDAAYRFVSILKNDEVTKTPDGAPYTVSSVRAAMSGM